MNSDKVLVLRTVAANRHSYNAFLWPELGPVEAPDWDPVPECGGGLHGALRGEGHGDLFCWAADALWQVVEVDAASVVDLNGKVKFPRGVVLYTGDRLTATSMIVERHPGVAVIGATLTGGYGATLTGGGEATLTGGDGATLQLTYWDCAKNRKRIVTAYVGEDGIEAGVKYKLQDGKFVEAET